MGGGEGNYLRHECVLRRAVSLTPVHGDVKIASEVSSVAVSGLNESKDFMCVCEGGGGGGAQTVTAM